jgi:hypothetical protein
MDIILQLAGVEESLDTLQKEMSGASADIKADVAELKQRFDRIETKIDQILALLTQKEQGDAKSVL